jgi:serine/threonine-protein kinase
MQGLAGVKQRAAHDTQRLARAGSVERELIAGRYEVISLIGRGGMAEVHAGRDRMLERLVAIKRPRRDTDDAAISDRLKREAIALAMIDSPHVVAIHDVGVTPDGVYLVMQRLYGRTLDDEVGAAGPVPPGRAVRIARDILGGLAAIHAAGLVHRDLKPSNVLLDRGDRAVLLDLGAALHPRRRPLTAPGTVLGTPGCMAPEQLEQGPLDGRVDLFQLGLILIYLVTGELPEREADPGRLAIPPALRGVIARALAPAEARFCSALEMRSALDRALEQALGQALAARGLEPIEPAVSEPDLRWPEPIPR